MFSHAFVTYFLPNNQIDGLSAKSLINIKPSAPPTRINLILIVLCPFALGYFLSYLFRSTNAIIAPQLISEIGIDASDLGLLTAMYFLTFSLFQLPLGILLDRYGPRLVQSFLLLFAGVGAVLFANGETIETLAIGRGLIGLGVAGCLMASLKAATLWFDERHWPTINGAFLMIGGLGAVAATTPLELALKYTDWRMIFMVLSGLTMFVALLIFFVVPERQKSNSMPALKIQIMELSIIYKSWEFWRCAPMIVTSLATNMAIQGLWAGPWLKDVAGFERDLVANYLMILALSMALGSLITGILASWLERFNISLLKFFGISMLLFMGFQTVITLGINPTSVWPWVGFGFLANTAMVVYAHLTRHFSPELSGRVITGVNVFVFGGVFLIQYLMGKVISLFPINNQGEYPPDAYFAAFGAVLVLQIITFIWFISPIKRPT